MEELKKINEDIAEAELRRDEDFLEKVLADGLVFQRADGSIADKRQYLAGLTNPENKYDYVIPQELKVTPNGDIAFVSLLVYAKGTRGGKEFIGTFRNQRVFMRRDGNWQCHIWVNSRA
jgi:ketosteroid isomerase-like protein